MASTRFFRYLAPNLITLSSMIFGLVSLWSSSNGNYPLAAWLIIYAVLTDRMDGLVARAVKGTSELGMQLDSFADFLNFGISPAFLVLSYLSSRPDLPYFDRASTAHTLLFVACGAWTLCAVFRLARYNVLSDDQIPTKIFFGFPTTLAGGLLAIWMLLLLKYDPSVAPFGGAKLFGDSLHTTANVWRYLPIAIATGKSFHIAGGVCRSSPNSLLPPNASGVCGSYFIISSAQIMSVPPVRVVGNPKNIFVGIWSSDSTL